MKRFVLFFVMILGVTFSYAQKKGKDQKISKVIDSEIKWWGYKVFKAEPTTYAGSLTLKKGYFTFEDDKLVDGDFLIDMKSLLITSDITSSDQEKLTKELKGANFFNVKKFPMVNFHLTKIIPMKDSSSEYNSTVYGNIIIKGIRKTISFPATVNITGTSASIQTAKFPLNRQTFGIIYKSAIKDYIIKDEMDVQFKVATK